MFNKINFKSLLFTILGILIMGIGCGMLVKIGYGADTSNALFTGISKVSGINIGNVNALMSVVLVALVYLTSKKRIGIGTLLVPLLVSFPVNFANSVFVRASNIYTGIILDIIALYIISIGAAFTIETELGASPYDAFALAISDFMKIDFVYAKYIVDGFCVIVGYFLGGEIGVGTILCFLLMGLFIKFNRSLMKKIFEK